MSDAVAHHTKAQCAQQWTDAQRCHTSINPERWAITFVHIKGAQAQLIQGFFFFFKETEKKCLLPSRSNCSNCKTDD